jgi:predicted nucleotidyltransferase
MPENNILDSFSQKDELCPNIWDGFVLKKEVRERLLKIAKEFIESIDEKFSVKDITMSGSLANYNWSQYSDIDLHIVIDYSQFKENKKLYQEIFDTKKKIFNEKYEFKIKKHDVEIYPQDSKEKHYSSGVYSIKNNKWIKKPTKKDFEIDEDLLTKKTKYWLDKIKDLISKSKKQDLGKYKKEVKSLKEKLKKYRTAGLSKEGEYSYENLVFKYIRRSGAMKKLFDSLKDKKNKELSLEIYIQEQLTNFFGGTSNFINELTKFGKQVESKVFTLNPKKYDANVERVQRALEILGYPLSKYGADGKFGNETNAAIDKFRADNSLEKGVVLGKKDIDKIIEKLKSINFKDSDLTKANYKLPEQSEKFTYVDLNNPEGYQKYKEICDNFIKGRNPNSPVTGTMMADSAKKFQYAGYVPPELACAQLALEGGLSSDKNSRPIMTKNPFNIGNTDVGKNRYFSSFERGVEAYYRTMTRLYLPKGKKAEDLLGNFKSVSGYRYASNPSYESKLNQIITSIA